jgi:hypothetical protein
VRKCGWTLFLREPMDDGSQMAKSMFVRQPDRDETGALRSFAAVENDCTLRLGAILLS